MQQELENARRELDVAQEELEAKMVENCKQTFDILYEIDFLCFV